jgi:hypothetical protein
MDSSKAARAALLTARDPYKRAKRVVSTTGRYADGGEVRPSNEYFSDPAVGTYPPLNAENLIKSGAMRVTQPGNGRDGGFDASDDPELYSLVSHANDTHPDSYTRAWPDKPSSYENAAGLLNKPGTLYAGKYRQLVWSAQQRGMPARDIYLPSAYQQTDTAYADGGAVDTPPDLNQQGLYSHAAQIAQTALQQQAPPAQVRSTLLNKGVKPDELKWSGFDEKLGAKPMVTRDEVVQHFRSGLPNVQETQLGGIGRNTAPKFEDKTLPGGENYRELLMHMPPASADEHRKVLADLEQARRAKADAFSALRQANEANAPNRSDMRTAYAQALMRHDELQDKAEQSNREAGANNYRSSHWDEPNVLAHLRLSDRKLPGGGKALHLEELQSDWGQQGRETGFRDDKREPGKVEPQEHGLWKVTWPDGSFSGGFGSQQAAEGHAAVREESAGVPRAPYVDSTAKWTDLGLKRALHEAAKGGYDKLLITPGEEQAKRYDLSKQVDAIYTTSRPSKPGHVELAVRPKGANDYHEVGGDSVPFEELHRHIGKDLAEKIIADHKAADPARGAHNRTYEGLDLKVGGEGMKGYYDKIVPSALQKLVKKHDPSAEVKLHTHPVRVEPDMSKVNDEDIRQHHELSSRVWGGMSRQERMGYRNDYARDNVEDAKLHSIDITPKMRASILKGQTAYARGGSVPPNDTGIVSQALQIVPDEHPVVQQAQQILQTQAPRPVRQPVDPMTTVHSLSTTPQAQSEQVMQANADRGLIFPRAPAAERLRLKLARAAKATQSGEDAPGMPANPRTVIRAPEPSPDPTTGIVPKKKPDFVVGRITPEDWVRRHENILEPAEIRDASGWYQKVYDTFLQQTHGDAERAKEYMRGWLVTQQNVDVSGAMNNVLLQKEQMNRGVPEDQMRAAGMPNPTAAARSVIAKRPITGVGQKISDFVDSAEGKDVRSWMANHPDGGKPFVVDVHTARDTGIVDQKLINHLTRLGYNAEDIARIRVDMAGSPSETQYENRAQFGQQITEHLNNINWQGRNDWTPMEVQAVGWMGMTKLTANQADDVVSGLDRNMRRISMELAPGEGSPWHKKYGDAFAKLAPADQYELTHHMTQKAIEHASKLAGIDVRDIVHGTGGWQQYQNPSTVGQALATKEGAEIASNALGHLLQQTEVWSNSVKPVTSAPKGFAVDFIADGDHNLHTDEGLRDFWGKVMDADPLKGTKKALFQGYQPIRTVDGKVGIRALIDRGGTGTMKILNDAVEGPIRRMAESLPFDVHAKMHEAEIMKARNDWNEDNHGQAYKSRLVDLLKRDPTAELGRAGQELEEEFAKKLREKTRLTRAAGGAANRGEAGVFRKRLLRGKTDTPANGRSIVDRALQLVHKGAPA